MTRSARRSPRTAFTRSASTGTSTSTRFSTTPGSDTPDDSTALNNNSDPETTSSAIYTPGSSSDFHFSDFAGSTFEFRGIEPADRPLPSVENDLNTPVRAVSPFSQSTRSPTPFITVSTPPSTSASPSHLFRNIGTPQGTGDGVSDIDARLRDVHLRDSTSPSQGLGLGQLAAALPENQTPPRDLALRLPHQYSARGARSPEASAARRRRSSSRINQTPHEVRDEEPPQDRFHEPAFQRAFSEARSLMDDLARALESSQFGLYLQPDSTIHRLQERAREIANFQCPPTRIVGLVGDSGVGKSSLLNSLLDYRNLARTSSGGVACTCVATEYLYHDADNFIVNVETFGEDELAEQFTQMVHDYRHHHLRAAVTESNEERSHWEELAQRAHDTFSAMFRGRFSSSMLESDWPEHSMVETLLAWAHELGPANNSWSETKASLPECAALLADLTSERGSNQRPAVWPYIKKISVFLKAHVLSKGLILVDLPGLRDLNAARRKITERYLLRCNEIFAVCCIDRATSDAGVMDVFELAQRAQLSNVGIICTKSDVIVAEEAARDREDHQATEIQALIESLNAAKRELSLDREHLEELNRLDDLSDEEEEEKAILYERIGRATIDVENRELGLKRYTITTRNASVTASLEDRYMDRISGGNLRVFCVSNSMYWDYRDKPKEKALPFLRLSGILDVRKHCMAIVSESQFRIAVEYIHDDIPELLNNIELWDRSSAGSADGPQKQAMRRALDELEAHLRRELTGGTTQLITLSRTLEAKFGERLYQYRRQSDEWTRGAVNAGMEWSNWAHQTYAAFCRNDGIHTTNAAGYRNWNEEAMRAAVSHLSEPWTTFRSVLESHLDTVVLSVHDIFNGAINHLTELMDRHRDTLLPLHIALTSRQRHLATAVEALCDRFGSELSTLRTDAFEGLTTSIFARCMEDTYRRAKGEFGNGSWARKKAIINGKLRDDGLFREWMRKFRDKFGELATALQTDVQAVLDENLHVIKGTLDVVRTDNAATEREEDPEFSNRIVDEAARVKARMERIRNVAGERS
ncbi:Nuclear GTPase SLIP-GC [Madurella mycetomatis]|uniref:Nuclear GTPase SLIP-GC n=1 Tax=Madurella mycetomatis TaxID=100816 RepID=A0A175VZF8_9PEZI|nr:Nuclear GTPase SLIP-GC [Madurella mycetomatis]